MRLTLMMFLGERPDQKKAGGKLQTGAFLEAGCPCLTLTLYILRPAPFAIHLVRFIRSLDQGEE
jgi:hypothetical protein